MPITKRRVKQVVFDWMKAHEEILPGIQIRVKKHSESRGGNPVIVVCLHGASNETYVALRAFVADDESIDVKENRIPKIKMILDAMDSRYG